MDPFADTDKIFSVFQGERVPQQTRSVADRAAEVAELDAKKRKREEQQQQQFKPLPDDDESFDLDAAGDDNEDSVMTPATIVSTVAAADASSSKSQEQQQQQQQQNRSDVVFVVASKEDCLHEIAFPPNYAQKEEDTQPLPPRKPAKEYPFVLDAFQRESINCLERSQSVLVSAHTSAGKTAIAEYAIAMSLRDKSRVIYTSPIKALSNQKYRELTEEFQDVGLMTGDVTMRPGASCLVMTTEILRSMLYRGSEILHEVAWVIFDEVHYMRDRERGVVWEETMILLPNTVRYIFLSATIPNAKEFAEWIAKLKGQPVHVVYTDYRPTPLQHYIFPCGGDGIHLVVDEKGRFKEENFQKALMTIKAKGDTRQTFKRKRTMDGQSDIYKIIKMIMDRNFQPVIVFSFSRKDCEALAIQMAKLDLNEDQEKDLVEEVFTNAVDSLSDDDKRLPQVEHMLPLLKRGIGIHHSGLLPIIKEVIEILFQEGLVKVLFSTETFSMGLNMPARTVVFTNIRKYDGTDFRTITSGEYIQMSGRAGRRGIDDRGIVIMMIDEELEEATARKMMSGKPDVLNSSFHLSYFMLLNLLRVEEINPEYIMERSFLQYQSEKQRPALEEQCKLLEKERDAIAIQNEQQIASYYTVRRQLDENRNELRQIITKPIYILPFLTTGRLAKVRDGEDDWGWGTIVNFQRKKSLAAQDQLSLHKASDYVVDILLHCAHFKRGSVGKPKPCPKGETGELQVIPIQLDLIECLSSVRLVLPKNLASDSGRASTLLRLNEVKKRFEGGIPMLDPVQDMKINNRSLTKIVDKIEALEQRLHGNPICKHDKLQELYNNYSHKMQLETEILLLKKKVKDAAQLILKEELKKMMRVLRRLSCVTADNVIDTKGRVACEVSAGDELLITEMMFSGVFNDLTAEQISALMSCLVFDEKSSELSQIEKSIGNLPEELSKPYRLLQEAAKRVGKVMEESKIEMDPNEYVASFSPNLMEVTYAWANGSKFYEICKMTDVFEGSIVRMMRRLEELLRQVCVAAKSIGDTVLEQKFMQAITKIKRDIAFSSSLYL